MNDLDRQVKFEAAAIPEGIVALFFYVNWQAVYERVNESFGRAYSLVCTKNSISTWRVSARLPCPYAMRRLSDESIFSSFSCARSIACGWRRIDFHGSPSFSMRRKMFFMLKRWE